MPQRLAKFTCRRCGATVEADAGKFEERLPKMKLGILVNTNRTVNRARYTDEMRTALARWADYVEKITA